MASDLTYTLILAATAADGLLAGASIDQSIKQLPARHRIGAIAYSAYAQAADLGPGILWYGILGVSAAALTIAAAVAGLIARVSAIQSTSLIIAAVLAILHSLTTTQAATTMFSSVGSPMMRPHSPTSSTVSRAGKRCESRSKRWILP